jgi:hypothetical protein
VISFLCLFLGFIGMLVIWAHPFVGLIIIGLAVAIASDRRARFDGDMPEMIMFYAACAGVLTACTG